VSWRIISNDEFDKIIPVTPPVVNKKINPIAHSNGASYFKFAP
jgi:hypothetical protein